MRLRVVEAQRGLLGLLARSGGVTSSMAELSVVHYTHTKSAAAQKLKPFLDCTANMLVEYICCHFPPLGKAIEWTYIFYFFILLFIT